MEQENSKKNSTIGSMGPISGLKNKFKSGRIKLYIKIQIILSIKLKKGPGLKPDQV